MFLVWVCSVALPVPSLNQSELFTLLPSLESIRLHFSGTKWRFLFPRSPDYTVWRGSECFLPDVMASLRLCFFFFFFSHHQDDGKWAFLPFSFFLICRWQIRAEFKVLPALPCTGGEKVVESGKGAVFRPSHEPMVENSFSRDKSGNCTARFGLSRSFQLPFPLSACKKAEAAQFKKTKQKTKQEMLWPLLGVNVDSVNGFHRHVFLLNTKIL